MKLLVMPQHNALSMTPYFRFFLTGCFILATILFSAPTTAQDSSLMDKALNGDTQAQMALADKIAAGQASQNDLWQAVVLYAMAEQGGHPKARAARLHLTSSGQISFNAKLAANFDLKTSQSSVDVTKMANAYMVGRNTNFVRARLLHAYIYARGLTQNGFYLGVSFLVDKGPDYSPSKAEQYFKAASDKLLAVATYNLGWIYENGLLGLPDYDKAIAYYNLAIEREVAIASYRLANMYAQGQGVPRNLSQAIKLYDQARRASYVGRKDSGNVFEQANIRYLQLEQSLNIQSGKWRLSDEGEFFQPSGASSALPEPITSIIGTISATLDFCNADALHKSFRTKVMNRIDEARTEHFKDEIKKRIRTAYKAKEIHMQTYSTQTFCEKQDLQRDVDNTLVLMEFDWGFQQKPTTAEHIFRVADRDFVIGRLPYSLDYENKVAGLIKHVSRN